MGQEYQYDEHGVAFSNTRLYKIWGSMKARCNTPSHTSYQHYGGRGITVCPEWSASFACFREWAIETGYDETASRGQYTLERKDTDGPYSPENCCWVTIQAQELNKRTNIFLEDDGEQVCLKEYCRRHGLSYSVGRYHLSPKEKETVLGRREAQRRASGVQPREEYNRKRAEQAAAKLTQLKEAMEKNPGMSNRKLASLLGISEAGVRRMKGKIKTET